MKINLKITSTKLPPFCLGPSTMCTFVCEYTLEALCDRTKSQYVILNDVSKMLYEINDIQIYFGNHIDFLRTKCIWNNSKGSSVGRLIQIIMCSMLYSSSCLCRLVTQTSKEFCWIHFSIQGLILGLRPANEERCYFVTMYLIGWMQT